MEETVLSYYEDLFAQFVGSYGYTVYEAYSKAYGIIQMTEADKKRANSVFKRKKVKEKIKQYREEVEKKNIEIASGKVGFEKADAMQNLQNVLYKCQEVLNAPEISEGHLEILRNILEGNLDLHDEYNGKELVKKKNPNHIRFYNEIMYLVQRPSFSPKTAEVLLKANRQACELYNLVNSNVKLQLDDDALKAVNLLNKVASEEELEKLAFGDENEE